MRKIHICLATVVVIGLSGCGGSPSDICAAVEATEAISKEAKDNYVLYNDVLAATEEPHYKKNEAWISQFENIEALQKKSEGVKAKLEKSIATCIAMDEAAAQDKEVGAGSREQFLGGDAAGGIASFGVGIAVALVKPGIDAMSPAQKRKDIWTPMCSGDFTPLHKEHQYGTAMADALFPNRYAFWFNTVEKLSEDSNRLDQSIADAEVALQEYEQKIYSGDFEKIKYELREMSLIDKNEDETSFQCSANVTGLVEGYAPVFKNLNYSVLVTTEGKRKVSIAKDEDYNALISSGSGE